MGLSRTLSAVAASSAVFIAINLEAVYKCALTFGFSLQATELTKHPPAMRITRLCWPYWSWS